MSVFVTHVITTINLGGAEKQLLLLAAQQKKQGCAVEIIFLKDRPALLNEFISKEIKVDTTFSTVSFMRQIFKLRKKRSTEGVIYHAHLPRAELLCALALKSRSFIVTRHNSEPFFPKAPQIISRFLSRAVLGKAFASISISRAVSDYLEKSQEMANSRNNFIIHYGLESTRITSAQKQFSNTNFFQVGTVARLSPQKNLPLLLESIRIFNQNNLKKCHLTIVGTGPLRDELNLLAVRLGIQKYVTWRGEIRDVETFYRSLDVFVLSSDYEGFGLVLLEAMFQGIPVVARKISAIPEVLGENHPGMLESDNPRELASRIKDFLTNKALINTCLVYQSSQIKNFSIQKTHLAHLEVYYQFLEKKGWNVM